MWMPPAIYMDRFVADESATSACALIEICKTCLFLSSARPCRSPNIHIFKTKISKLAGFDWCEIGNKNAIFLLFFVFLEEDH